MENEDTKSRTIWCGNLSNRVNDEIIYELFLQVILKFISKNYYFQQEIM